MAAPWHHTLTWRCHMSGFLLRHDPPSTTLLEILFVRVSQGLCINIIYFQQQITRYFSDPQYYFQVNDHYVKNKLKVVLFPFLHRVSSNVTLFCIHVVEFFYLILLFYLCLRSYFCFLMFRVIGLESLNQWEVDSLINLQFMT